MPLRPLNNTVFIELEENEYLDSNPEVVRIAKEGKIILPDNNSIEKISNKGKLVSWGDQCRYKKYYKVGGTIVFKRFGGANFYHEDKKLRVLLEDEILALYD